MYGHGLIIHSALKVYIYIITEEFLGYLAEYFIGLKNTQSGV